MFSYGHSATSWQQVWHIYMTLTYSSIFAFLNAYCSPFPVFLKPPVGGELGAWSLSSLLAALIIIIIILFLLQTESHFRGPKHARKVRKLCTHIRTGENLRLIWVSGVGVAKWLDNATYKYSAECASSYVSRTCTKIGTLV